MSKDPTLEEELAYITGLKDGVTKYAWWKDGTQYVGTCGRTLKEALSDIDKQHWNLKEFKDK